MLAGQILVAIRGGIAGTTLLGVIKRSSHCRTGSSRSLLLFTAGTARANITEVDCRIKTASGLVWLSRVRWSDLSLCLCQLALTVF